MVEWKFIEMKMDYSDRQGRPLWAIMQASQTLENSSSTSAYNGVWHLKQDYLDHLCGSSEPRAVPASARWSHT